MSVTTRDKKTSKALTQARQLEQQGHNAEAGVLYRRLIDEDPKCHAAYYALGMMAFATGNFPLTAKLIKKAFAIDSSNALYARDLCEVLRRMGRLDEAQAAGRRSVQLEPRDLRAHYNLGLACSDAGNAERAVQCYRAVVQLNPMSGVSWNLLGSALQNTGDQQAAEEAFASAVAINPLHAEAQNNLGRMFLEQSQLDKARACFEAAIAARPDLIEAHFNLRTLKTYTRSDPHLAMLENLQTLPLNEHSRMLSGFALGKALDDIDEIERAFAAYDMGNHLRHAQLPIDERAADDYLERIIQTFSRDFFAARRGWRGSTARAPIFIVGMPRSGTTLLEQILCSHASVYGAGELGDLNDVVKAATGATPTRPFTEGVVLLNETELRRLGDDYLQRVWHASPHSAFITDKMPSNFFYLGLIHLALPGAKIIHAMRDPMDSCFSCFTRLFKDSMPFTYDQGTLGRYYVRYIKLMRHWHAVLPPGSFLDVRYEDMVADTEAQARRVLAFIGLPWDENCLNFHQNTRVVRTASAAQVRKPIYQTSVARWRKFAPFLQPLYDIVKDYREADDEDPPTAEALHLEGLTLYQQGRIEASLALFRRALEIRPDFPAALNSLGFVLQDLDQIEAARDCFERAVALAPGMSIARFNLATAQLKLGDWQNGWENYESRWSGAAEAENGPLAPPTGGLPQWDGRNGQAHQRLLVVTEQGFGDTFMFSRYLALAAERFSRVAFACAPQALRLMEWAFGDRVALFIHIPADSRAWDLQCPLLSLPRAFATRSENVPADIPYLRVPDPAAAYWRERLARAAPNRLRIGIAWAGRKTHQYDAQRSLRFEQILPLLQATRLTWVNLQKYEGDEPRPAIPPGVDWIDWSDEFTDFADTAALICNLDLVLSIDSAMVHLAGALGRPVWMLNRFNSEWRWLRHREDSVWYPGLRIFNQPSPGDWQSVRVAVSEALEQMCNEYIPQGAPSGSDRALSCRYTEQA